MRKTMLTCLLGIFGMLGCGEIEGDPTGLLLPMEELVTTFESAPDTELFVASNFSTMLPNSCAVTAAEVSKRQLGIETGLVDDISYINTAVEVKYTAKGTPMTAYRAYFESKGFTVNANGFPIDTCLDYSKVAIKQNQGCSVALLMILPFDDESHIETVIGTVSKSMTECEMHTNSWGLKGTIKGFSNNGFSHSHMTYLNKPSTQMEAFFICPGAK